MKLSKCEIINFRSIGEQEISFNPSCRILVGINESGKSNVLKALRLISDEFSPSVIDIRNELNEEKIESSDVTFGFEISKDDRQEIYKEICKHIIFYNLDEDILYSSTKKLNIREWIEETLENGYFTVDIKEDLRFGWAPIPSGYNLSKPLYKPVNSIAIAKGGEKFIFNDQEYNLSTSSLLDTFAYEYISSELVEEASYEDLTTLISRLAGGYIKKNLPECIYWTYEEKNLLPATISMDKFGENPDIALPLKNMFLMAGIKDIKDEINLAKLKKLGVRNLLQRIARVSTSHIRSIWKEFPEIELLLEPNGEFIDISIKDSFNRYDFASRSDGFKRFVSFLLIISAKVKTEELTNTLILIDEPEISLHPTGSKQLLDELLKISENNLVVFSTHSIFMIDRKNVKRHILVKKENESTILTEASTTNIQEEEVIFNALGYSVFETLKAKNIIFEGWKDHKIFEIALTNTADKHKDLILSLNEFGVAFLQGVKDAGRVTTLLELASRKYLIISDDDQPAKEAQKNFKGNGNWKRYSELLPKTQAVTGEDFLKWSLFEGEIIKISNRHGIDTPFKTDHNNRYNKLNQLKKWMQDSKIEKAIIEKEIRSLKDLSIDNISPDFIEDEYYNLLDEIIKTHL